MISQTRPRQIVDPCFLANPAVIAHDKPPGKLDSHVRLDDDALSDMGAKQAEQADFKRRDREPSTLQDDEAGCVPSESPRQGAAGIERRGVVGREIALTRRSGNA